MQKEIKEKKLIKRLSSLKVESVDKSEVGDRLPSFKRKSSKPGGMNISENGSFSYSFDSSSSSASYSNDIRES